MKPWPLHRVTAGPGALLGLWLLLAGAVCAASVAAHMVIGLNNDTLLLTGHAAKMLDGGKAYVDFADVDPPLIYLIFTLPVMLARLAGWPVHIALNLFDMLLCAASLCAAAAILRHSTLGRGKRWLLMSAVALAMLALSFTSQVFADREHWVMVLIVPWLALCAPAVTRRDVPVIWRLMAAVMAGLGFAIKPYAGVIFMMTVACRLVWERSPGALLRQWELYVVACIGLAYAALVPLFFPEYVQVIMPVAADTYRALSWNWGSKMGVIEYDLIAHYSLVWLAVLPVLWLVARKSVASRGVAYLVALLAACAAAYALGGGWYYARYPYMAVSLVLSIVAGGKLVAACWRLPRGRICAALAVCALLMAGLWHCFGREALDRETYDVSIQRMTGHPMDRATLPPAVWEKLAPLLEKHPKFLWLAFNLWAPNIIPPGALLQHVGRFDYLWTLPGTLELADNPARKDDFARLSTYLGETVAEDIERHRPQIIISDISPHQHTLPQNYDVMKLLMRTPRFNTALKNYTPSDTINTCNGPDDANCAYRVFLRKRL